MTAYGPGDPQTWGPPTGHPNDPRTVGEGCPGCDGPMDEDGDCLDGCGWSTPEPDYESMVEPEPDTYREWAGEESPW